VRAEEDNTHMEKLLAVTAIGPDRTGLVRDVSQVVTDAGGNIQESRMIALGSEFALLMLVAGNWHAVGKVGEKLEQLQKESNLTITIRDSAPRGSKNSAPYTIDIVALDHEGIVFGLSEFFASRELEIAEMNSRRYPAPHTGAPMFSMQMTVNVPSTVQVSGLRDEFLEYCETENLDAIIEPADR
jgi:glycine cleavage system transcriptional repressor